MYLSFIQDEKDALQEKLDRLDEIGDAFEGKAEDIIEELREEMRERIYDAVSEIFGDFGIEDNYYNEKEQEVIDALSEKITQEI